MSFARTSMSFRDTFASLRARREFRVTSNRLRFFDYMESCGWHVRDSLIVHENPHFVLLVGCPEAFAHFLIPIIAAVAELARTERRFPFRFG